MSTEQTVGRLVYVIHRLYLFTLSIARTLQFL